jgi:catechol 2,3-dioxygenase-like lactoylglutathione lyase family enzyme
VNVVHGLWAIGSKVADPLAEAAFFEAMGAVRKSMDRRLAPEGETIVVFMVLGGVNFHLTNRLRYEGADPPPADMRPGRPGLAHFVLDVGDMKALADRAVALGATEIHPRMHIAAGHGEMKAAFLRSPGGILFQLVERIRDADADYARDYRGVPAERVIG